MIVRARKPDIAALATLMGASALLRRYAVSERTARASLAEAFRARDILFVARDGNEILGFAWVIATRALDRTAYLRLLLVAEGRRSRGVGSALLGRSEREARAAKCRHVALLVTGTNRRARAFYARLGYRHVGDLPDFARPGLDEALYVKSWPRSRRP